jgi:hypothetical protein
LARVKETIFQRDFAFGAVREDFLEADDLELRQASLKTALNVRALATRAIEERPGTFFGREIEGGKQIKEIRPSAGLVYLLIICDDHLQVVDSTADQIYRNNNVPWTDGDDVWIENFRGTTVLGGDFGVYTLQYDEGSFSMGGFEFADGPGGEILQPYWSFHPGTTIQPSAVTGNISLTASGFDWQEDHVGLRVRYNYREVLITEFISTSTVNGTVVNDLPPSFSVAVGDGSQFRVGDVVIGSDSGYQGIVTEVVGNTLSLSTLARFQGPDVSEDLSSPSGSSSVSATYTISPEPSSVWDEPLMSDLRGWPRAGGSASGRLVLTDFENAESVIATSSSRAIEDFGVGAADDDAIARKVGDNSPRWLHCINMGDLVLLADNGCYIVNTRDNGILTPATFNVVLVDETGSSSVRPVRLKDGVVFVEAGGASVSAMVLDGNVYLKWSVRNLTRFHDHLIRNPVYLSSPAQNSLFPEKYVFVVNSDGTLAALSFQENIREERYGFVPWETDGEFVAVTPFFNTYWAIVNRTLGGETRQILERFDPDAVMDCATEIGTSTGYDTLDVNGEPLEVNGVNLEITGAVLTYLIDADVTVHARGWDVGDFTVNSEGQLDNEFAFSGTRQIGLPFTVLVAPWPMEVVDSPRFGTLTARVLQMVVSVQNSLGFTAQCNNYSATVGDYLIGADLTEPPAVRTQRYRFSIFGNRDHPEMTITRTRPGPLRILAIGQRVQA